MKTLSVVIFSCLLATGTVLAVPQSDSPTRSTPTRIPTNTILPPTPSATCTCPGPILCCNEIVDSESADGQAILSGLGVTITGSHIPLGKGCLENMVCPPGIPCPPIACINPVCCFEFSKPNFAAIGCTTAQLYPYN